ncbi:nad dependent epimerase dehydratase family protein [Diplodia corticola]|uniref:Nad dependent epimerase dehydratase family protein n=1 Tax=Diplodia corticola TaxID=236234 RepID=A0A1J9RF26_9PEZI|nr:nad dependent epimerase dehydratase family protein [Diplodia corticola]OJD31163.1 nad dependent epimerase dehydratase family protein [Diplodia corticola]
MSGELVFITGAAGFLGANVVLEALKAGYRVRASVRKDSQVKQLESYFNPEFGSKAEFVIVPDITKSDAYDGLLGGVSYVFHVASPLAPPSTNWKKDHIDPAVNGTVAILKAANGIGSIKKCVITGSIADLIPWSDWPAPDEAITEDHNYDLDVSPDLDFKVSFVAYRASKLLAAKAAREFFVQQKPHYAIVSLHPTFIFGHHILQTSSEDMSGSRAMLWASLKGPDQRIPILNHVHVTDVAQAHIKALDPRVTGYQKFILSAEPGFPDWEEVLQFVKQEYPNEQWSNAPSPGKRNINVSKAERVLGMDWIGWRQQVIDTVEPQLELIKKAATL